MSAGTPDDVRAPIAAAGTRENPHAHLDPIVAAELSWGNRITKDWHIVDYHFGDWLLTLEKPFHVDRLRETFVFPGTIRLGTYARHSDGSGGVRMCLGDQLNLMGIEAPLPKDLPAVNAEIEL
ncbi:hypothetical protein [Streptomyces sp. RKAG293]|uniref:hypothetical protein n=1 Tax=Streptomyces sp. RKAG293 TaxID=2893403 RepID=UPI0020334292|nr:hypothetical protein [Streptomyces sp. RKAG293]MCM2418792.1 hypothetical protein [Streptomyces sp. RKAG293]